MAQRDLLKSSLDAGRDVTAKAQERLEAVLNEITKAAQDQADQVQKFTQEIVERSRKSYEKLLKSLDTEIRAQIANAGLATKADIRRLEKKIEAIGGKQAAVKKSAGSTAEKAAKKSASPAKRAAKKAAATKAR
jgi:polyhydroxyalkanoate synthesis regulator phasin